MNLCLFDALSQRTAREKEDRQASALWGRLGPAQGLEGVSPRAGGAEEGAGAVPPGLLNKVWGELQEVDKVRLQFISLNKIGELFNALMLLFYSCFNLLTRAAF